jgi:hypothetical protein
MTGVATLPKMLMHAISVTVLGSGSLRLLL